MSKLKIQHELDLDMWWNAARMKVDRMLARSLNLHPARQGWGIRRLDLGQLDIRILAGNAVDFYDMTGDAKYKEAAWEWDIRMERLTLEESRFHHDVGFQYLPTAVLKYKLTGDADGRRRGLAAANFLAGRFNLAGQYIRAWNKDLLVGLLSIAS